LLMDEPFGALDPLTAENLRSQVVDLWRDPATGVNTLVIVTHSVEKAVFLAGRIVVFGSRSEEHTSELQLRFDLVCCLLLEKKEEGVVVGGVGSMAGVVLGGLFIVLVLG